MKSTTFPSHQSSLRSSSNSSNLSLYLTHFLHSIKMRTSAFLVALVAVMLKNVAAGVIKDADALVARADASNEVDPWTAHYSTSPAI